MSFCKNCGKELQEDARFCSRCGTPIDVQINSLETNIEQLSKETYVPQSIEDDLLKPIDGAERVFILRNKNLVISKDMDEFNSYRIKFREMAKKCSDNAVHEYLDKINNFDTFMGLFIDIYESHLKLLTKKAFDILISKEIYDITYDDFHNQHKTDFHLAIDDYNTIIKSCKMTEEVNQKVTSAIFGASQNALGKYVNKKISNSTINSFMHGCTEGYLKESEKAASKITDSQKNELYGRITPHILFTNIFIDYWNVLLSLAFTLNKYGHSILFPTKDMEKKANSIFQNISNPNFNQEKLIDVLFQIITIFPYNKKYYKFMEEKFGVSEEVTEIKNYFGFDFDEVIYSEEEYPKPKAEMPSTNESQGNGSSAVTNILNKFKVEKGSIKNAFMAGAKSGLGKTLDDKFGNKY